MNNIDLEETNQFKAGNFTSLNDNLKTNWPFPDEHPRQPKQIELWFVDNQKGTTICECKTLKAAKKFAKMSNGIIRYYCPTPNERDEELATNRENKRLRY